MFLPSKDMNQRRKAALFKPAPILGFGSKIVQLIKFFKKKYQK